MYIENEAENRRPKRKKNKKKTSGEEK